MGEMADYVLSQADFGWDDFDEESFWTTKEGVTIPVHELTDEHIKNILRYFPEDKLKPPAFGAVLEEAQARGLQT